ncbi:MAG: alpha-amylase family glycosyl hydrolase [Propionibacteriaceae bacterium]|nr:alpha-amylase family glycosyl hydrolase [Propionibacteriaceae bacterium]
MTRPAHRPPIALAAALGFAASLSLSAPAWAAPDVSLIATFEDEVAGCADWTPACPALVMTPGADGTYAVSVDVPAGAWQFQVADGSARYGADGQDGRTPLWLAGPATLQFRTDPSSHVTTVVPQGAQAPGASPDVSLAAGSVSAPGERFYFLLGDRFANGDPSNDNAIVPDNRRPDVVTHPADPAVSGYDPTRMGFYQGGDLQGVIDRLDYIKGLGATAIWISPPFVNMPVSQGSAGYHGYWITDFTHIDPHLGGDAAMTELITRAHAAGLKVFFDIVLNDTADTISYRGVGDEPPYVPLATRPYTDASGKAFDPADYATGTNGTFPAMDATTSFPYVPYRPDPGVWLVPEQLNDLTWYHNRGSANTSGNDESTLYGDFAGMDDLMTERPELAKLMVDEVAAPWLARGVDGFRIDTVKYVGLDFWTLFDAGVHQASDKAFVFGEAYDQNVPQIVSPPMRIGGMDGMLDFPYALALPDYLRGGDAGSFARVFDTDAYYATGATSANDMVTFVDNHDMGRLGSLLGQDTPDLQRRIELAYELTYLVRGQPVVYYGDEQGFLGTGGDVDARQPMFGPVDGGYAGSPYAASPLAGGGTMGANYAAHVYDTSAPLYRMLADLAALRDAHPALSRKVIR